MYGYLHGYHITRENERQPPRTLRIIEAGGRAAHSGAAAKLRGGGAKGDDEAERQPGRAQAELHRREVIRAQAAGLDHRQSGLFGHDQIKGRHAGRRADRSSIDRSASANSFARSSARVADMRHLHLGCIDYPALRPPN